MDTKQIENRDGLFVDTRTNPPTAIGYIFNFPGHGAFAPNGKVGEFSQDQIDTHNELLGIAEMQMLQLNGKGVMYLSCENGEYQISLWSGKDKIIPYRVRTSWHNMAGKDGRTDVDFSLDGSRWHGVNIGDNQILRVKRCKL